jgi:hypothetical protein
MIFIDNKYTHWYYSLITNAQSRLLPPNGYTEKHHIIPKSLGGNNTQSNLIILTAREHFLCHWMLTKMTTGKSKQSMVFALRMLRATSTNHQRYSTPLTARVYESIKKIHSDYLRKSFKGRIVSDATKQKMSVAAKNKLQNSFKGRKHTEESKSAIGNANRGKKRTEEQKERLSNSLRNMPAERREKLSTYRKTHPLTEESLNKIRKLYSITLPNGTTTQTNNLTEFCKLYSLSLPAMRDNVAKGKQLHHKGYKIIPIPKS